MHLKLAWTNPPLGGFAFESRIQVTSLISFSYNPSFLNKLTNTIILYPALSYLRLMYRARKQYYLN